MNVKIQICILEHNRTTHDDMHKLDEDFYLIVSPTILMNFTALKYEIEESYHKIF